MKGIKLIVAIVLVVVVAIGWISMIGSSGGELIEYNTAVKTADEWVKEGLYQRAIGKYEEALSLKQSDAVTTKMLDAYESRYQESTDIMSDYVSALEKAVALYPKNENYISRLVDMYLKMSDYDLAYDCLVDAVENGVNNTDLLAKKDEIRYAGDYESSAYSEFTALSENSYTVQINGKWEAIDNSGESLTGEYDYVSPSGSGVRVFELEKDTRLIDSTGMVLGIFEKKPESAGVYSEGLIPAKVDGKYAYYDSFAKKQFGDYDYAGAFSDGKAAVCIGGKWKLIDSSGKDVSKEFADIVVDGNGCYKKNSIIIAAETEGKYSIYDENLKKKSDFVAEQMDICTQDSLIAFQNGGKWGFVNTAGKVIIEPGYDEAKSFSNGLAAVSLNGEWGFINYENKLVIDYNFTAADYFNSNGSCMVRMDMHFEDDSEDENTTTTVWKLYTLNLGIRTD